MHGVVRTELTAVHEQEAAGAGELVRLLRGDSLSDLSGRSGLGNDILIIIVLVVSGGDPVLQDGIEVSLDIIGVHLVLVVVLLLTLRSCREGRISFLLLLLRLGLVWSVDLEIDVENVLGIELEVDLSVEIAVYLDLDLDLSFEVLVIDRFFSHGFLAGGTEVDTHRVADVVGGS